MKMLKSFLTFLFFTSFLLFTNCSECDNENPRARITNMGTDDVSILINTPSGDTENIENLESGKSSKFKSYAIGDITYTIATGNNQEAVETLSIDFCMDYEVIVNEDNSITTITSFRE